MHLAWRTDNCIYRTCLSAYGASDTTRFVHNGDDRVFLGVDIVRHGLDLSSKEIGKRPDCGIATGRAEVNVCLPSGNRLCVGTTARITALSALGLWKQGIDLFLHLVAFDLDAACGDSEYQTECSREYAERHDSRYSLHLNTGSVESREAHKGQRHQSGRYQRYGGTLKWCRDVGAIKSFA